MPTYLIHGFRWPRGAVRIHIILQNIDDAAPEWLVSPETQRALLYNFQYLFPESMAHLPNLRFVEQYDPSDLSETGVSQPYAYVADMAEEVKLGVDIDEVRGRGLDGEQWAAIMELRDRLAPEEKVGWFIVVCGDEERQVPLELVSMESSMGDRSVSPPYQRGAEAPVRPVSNGADGPMKLLKKKPSPEQTESKPSGLKKFLGSARLGRRKSRPNLADDQARSKSLNAASRESPGGALTHSQTNGSTNRSDTTGTPSTWSEADSTPQTSQDEDTAPAVEQSKRKSIFWSPKKDVGHATEGDTKPMYRRSMIVPDYRQATPDVEPKAAYMPPLAANVESDTSSRRRSGSFPDPRRSQTTKDRSSRRKSELPHGATSLTFDSGRSSSARYPSGSNNARHAVNPDVTFRPGGRVLSMPPPARSGAVSPLTSRDISPIGMRNGAVSPIVRSRSPTNETIGSLPQEKSTSLPTRSQITVDAKRQNALRQLHGLTLNTQAQRRRSSIVEGDEGVQEIISMSPAARQPVQRSTRRASRTSMLLSATSNGDSPALDRIVEGEAKPYFGQKINLDDVLAMKLESVFDRL